MSDVANISLVCWYFTHLQLKLTCEISRCMYIPISRCCTFRVPEGIRVLYCGIQSGRGQDNDIGAATSSKLACQESAV